MLRRARRWVALCLLLWAVADMCAPTLCRADAQAFVTQAAAMMADDSGAPIPPATDDCFCCSQSVQIPNICVVTTCAMVERQAAPRTPDAPERERAPQEQPPRAILS